MGCVSPQNSLDNNNFLTEIKEAQIDRLACFEPNYRDLINPRILRRMDRVSRMTIFAASLCLQESGEVEMDAILTGTGLGFMFNTTVFLKNIIESGDSLVSPTTFIQSTHNSAGGIIARMLNSNKYNFTYVHRGFSFESALLDAMLHLEEGCQNVLVGAFDEITEEYIKVMNRLQSLKRLDKDQSTQFLDASIRAIWGESAAFFTLGANQTEKTYAKIKEMKMVFSNGTNESIKPEIELFLEENGLKIEDIDLVLSGIDGNPMTRKNYLDLHESLLPNNDMASFKNLCGEHKTASSFALWMAAQILHKQFIPEVSKLNFKETKAKINNVLIYNNYNNINQSLILLEHV